MTLISAQHLTKSYSLVTKDDTRVLRDVSVDIARGEFVALTGPSGAGKSTLLHILGSLDLPDEGSVRYAFDEASYSLADMDGDAIARMRNKHIGFVFQFHQILPEFTALENVMIPMLIAGASRKQASARAAEMLDVVGMVHRAEHKPQELSGGEQQRVAIARALINEPDVLFADEPTGNLDSHNADIVLSTLMKARELRRCTLLVATHSAELARAADRIIGMKDGTVQ